MKFVTISDVHIKEPGDQAEDLFLSFLDSPEVAKSDKVFLLGDIFDLIVGGYNDYRYKFKRVFDALISLVQQGKEIYQFEGNHDFHFQELIKGINDELSIDRWHYYNKPFVMKLGERRLLLAHGDELELDNFSYHLYRSFIRSRFIYNLANLYCNFDFVEGIGQYLSKKSRKRNTKNYGQKFNQERIKNKYRKSAAGALERFHCDVYICGHSHCKDEWVSSGSTYYNNGYFPGEKTFLFYDGSDFHFSKVPQVD